MKIKMTVLSATLCCVMCSVGVQAEDQVKYTQTISQAVNPIAINGMVTSPNYLATASVMTVVYPQMCTMGGDNFWLIYNAKTGELKALNASGRSGEKASIDFYKKQGVEKIPSRGYLAANTVPGVPSGWSEAYQYSQKSMNYKISWSDNLQSAVLYAEKGFPVNTSLEYWLQVNVDPNDQEFRDLQRFDGFKKTFLKKDGTPYKTGEILKQPEIANTLKLISEKGVDEFYKGSIAKATVADFAQHHADWVEPIHVNYRDTVAYNFPPNTQGMASLEILNILNQYDVKKLGEGTADYYHLIIEATKEAFADRDKYLSDPDFVQIPLDYLLSENHAKDQAARISMKQAAGKKQPLDPKGDTVWIGAVDQYGNAVSLIQSIYHDFGSGIVAGNTGVLLQNRGSFFSLDPSHVNHLEPHKRTFHTLNPAMLLKNGKPYLVYGTMGGEGQPQTQASVVTRIVDFGLTPQEAITAPRWFYGPPWGTSSNDLKLEGRIPESVVNDLAKRGHPVKVVADFTDTMGHAGAILVNQEPGVLQGGTDVRGDGLAAGF